MRYDPDLHHYGEAFPSGWRFVRWLIIEGLLIGVSIGAVGLIAVFGLEGIGAFIASVFRS